MVIHDFDIARFILQEEPIEIQVFGSVLVDKKVADVGDVDSAMIIMKSVSGKLIHINCSRRCAYGYDQRIEVHGAKGMLRAENVLENTVEVATEAGFRRAPTQHFFLERYEAAYRAEMVHFVDAISGKGTMSPGVHDGLAAQLLADAAAESLSTGLPVTVA